MPVPSACDVGETGWCWTDQRTNSGIHGLPFHQSNPTRDGGDPLNVIGPPTWLLLNAFLRSCSVTAVPDFVDRSVVSSRQPSSSKALKSVGCGSEFGSGIVWSANSLAPTLRPPTVTPVSRSELR